MPPTVQVLSGVSIAFLNNVAIGVQNGAAFGALPNPNLITWQVNFVTPPASITVLLQGSNDGGVTWGTLDTSTSVSSGNIRSVLTSAPLLRAAITASSGGDFVTVNVVAKPMTGQSQLFTGLTVLGRQGTQTQTGANTNPTVLFTATLPAVVAAAFQSGRAITLRAWGKTAANANSKTITVTVGGDVYTILSGVVNNGSWWVEYILMKRQVGIQSRVGRAGVDASVSTVIVTAPALPIETVDTAFTIVGTNGTASAGDITCEGAILDVE